MSISITEPTPDLAGVGERAASAVAQIIRSGLPGKPVWLTRQAPIAAAWRAFPRHLDDAICDRSRIDIGAATIA